MVIVWKEEVRRLAQVDAREERYSTAKDHELGRKGTRLWLPIG